VTPDHQRSICSGNRTPVGGLASICGAAIPVLALMLALYGCGGDPDTPASTPAGSSASDPQQRRSVSFDLTAFTHAVIGGALVPIAGGGAERALAQKGPGTLDLFMRLPEDATIEFSLAAAAKRGDFGVSVTSDVASEDLVLEPGAGNRWRAQIANSGEAPVRLRFEVHTPGDFRWLRPRVTGMSRKLPPPISPSVRPPTGPVNVLFYLIDTARFDRFAVDGYDKPNSPNLSRLASQGLLLTGGSAPASATIPSVSALFASRHPSELGGRLDRKRRERKTLAEAFRDAGYATAAFQANYLLKRPLGFARGFDTYEVVTGKGPKGKRTARAAELHEPAVEWLRANANEPFFLYIQSMDVHHYFAPPAFIERFGGDGSTATTVAPAFEYADEEMSAHLRSLSARYDASIAYADYEIGKLVAVLDELGIAEKTVIVVTSDHGEPLGQRGALLHGSSLYEELIHIPAVIHLPWLSESRRIDDLFGLTDLGPTVADLAGVPIPAWWRGRSMLRSELDLRPRSAVGAIGVVRWGRRREPQEGATASTGGTWYIREGDWKLIQDRDGFALFHLPSDPGEERDRQAERPIHAQYLAFEIARRSPSFRADWRRPQPLGESLAEPEREDLQKALRELGYVE